MKKPSINRRGGAVVQITNLRPVSSQPCLDSNKAAVAKVEVKDREGKLQPHWAYGTESTPTPKNLPTMNLPTTATGGRMIPNCAVSRCPTRKVAKPGTPCVSSRSCPFPHTPCSAGNDCKCQRLVQRVDVAALAVALSLPVAAIWQRGLRGLMCPPSSVAGSMSTGP